MILTKLSLKIVLPASFPTCVGDRGAGHRLADSCRGYNFICMERVAMVEPCTEQTDGAPPPRWAFNAKAFQGLRTRSSLANRIIPIELSNRKHRSHSEPMWPQENSITASLDPTGRRTPRSLNRGSTSRNSASHSPALRSLAFCSPSICKSNNLQRGQRPTKSSLEPSSPAAYLMALS